uniref:Uncharacterized protein n=1 Tax=Lepeophtheirus salmonis TaxID=72036 RepID=A0A0K2U441_LEPSM
MEVAEIPKDIVSTDISPNSEDRNGGDPTDVVSGEDIVIEKARSEERIGEHDVRKPHSRKDWNTPWIRKDGKGLKKIFRNVHGIDPVAAPVKTSHNHFYSEPHSLLGPEPEPIPLEKLEEMREAISRTHELQRSEKRREEESLRTHRRVDFEESDPRETGFEIMKQESHEKGSESYCQVEKSQSTFGSQQFEQQQMEMTSPTPVCPEAEFCEGSEPPELEEIYDSHNHIQEGGEGIPSSVSNSENILYDVQEEGSLDHKEEREQQHDHLENLQSYLDLEELKKSMEKFTSMSSGHEPSADELIQVLKNLENLASSNTPMYLALVQLIEANQSNSFNDTMNHMNEDVNLTTNEILNTQEQREDVQCEKKEGEDRSVEEEEEGRGGMPAREMNEDTENNKEEKVPKESSEAEKVQDEVSIIQEQEDISMKKEKDPADLMERIAVKKQEVRRRVHAEPRKIRIVAGSQHRASWPCAPNVTNTTCPKVIEVILGETEEDSFSNRKEVAEKAGLKHIDVIVGDDSFYPQLFEDFEYPWKGSLRPVSDNMHRHESRDFDDEGVPWASSLRHVPDSQKRKKPSKTGNRILHLYKKKPHGLINSCLQMYSSRIYDGSMGRNPTTCKSHK